MKVGDVMSLGAATVRPEASLAEAARTMIEHRISGLPVVDGEGKLVGVVTEGDFLRQENGGRPRWIESLLNDAGGEGAARDLEARRVEELMSREVSTVGAEAPIGEVVELMERRKIKRLPVVADGKVIGIVSRANLLLALLRGADRRKGG